MGIQNAYPITSKTPLILHALVKAQAQSQAMHCSEAYSEYRDAFEQEWVTREAITALESEVKLAKAKLEVAKQQLKVDRRITRRNSDISNQLRLAYIARHNIDVEQYDGYVPGDELEDVDIVSSIANDDPSAQEHTQRESLLQMGFMSGQQGEAA